MNKKLNEINIDNIVNKLALQQKKKQSFIDDKKYIEILNSIIGQSLNNDDYENPKKWNDDVQMTFDLIYDTALDLIIKSLDFDGEIILNYKNNLISFTEIHGQGCFQSILPIEKYGDIEYPEYIVDFDNLEKFILTGEKPKRLYVMETVFLALDSLESFIHHYDLNINIDEVKDYLQDNLG